MEPVEVKPKRWFLARWWAAIWSRLVEPDPSFGPRPPLWTISTGMEVAELPKHLEAGARYLVECGALEPARVLGRNCIAVELTPATAREVADRLRARAEADAARGVYDPPPAPFPVLASNPLDTNTPSYFELAAWYRELWAEMSRQLERADRAEKRANLAEVRLNVDAARLADEVDALVQRRDIDSRSPAADALLDFRDRSPRTPRSDRLAAMDEEIGRLKRLAQESEAWGTRLNTLLSMLGPRCGETGDHEEKAEGALRRILDEREALRAELVKTLAILHDAETTPASGWALELAAAKENGRGVAALLEEAEAGAAAMREALERFEPSWGEGVVDATDGAHLREEGRAAALATTAGEEFLERYRAAVARGDRAEARLLECGWSISPDGALTDLQHAGLLERTAEGFRIRGGVPASEPPSGLTEGTGERPITMDPRVFGGKPSLRGARIAVEHILGMLAAGDSVDDLLKAYPNLDRADVLACVRYAHQLVAGLVPLVPEWWRVATTEERARCARIARALNPGDEGPAGYAHGQAIAGAIEDTSRDDGVPRAEVVVRMKEPSSQCATGDHPGCRLFICGCSCHPPTRWTGAKLEVVAGGAA